MKKLILAGKLALGALFFLPVNSCTNLDENLYDQVAESGYFRNEGEVRSAVARVYTTLYGLQNHNGYFSIQEINSGEVLIPQRGGDWEDGRQWIKTHLHTQVGNEESCNNAWSYLFGGITTANWVIYNVEQALSKGNIDAAAAAGYIAEVRGVRALYYYWLLDSFGNVPIVAEYNQDPTFLPATADRAEVYNFVETELKGISAALSREVGGDYYARFTYYAAQALLAHLYLNAEVYSGTAKWAEAEAAANEVINSGKFSLAAEYADNFKTTNEGSPEMIFAIPYDETFAQGFNLPQMTLHYESQKTFNLQAQPWNGYCAATDFYNSYDDQDVRKNNFLAGPQFASDGVTPLIDEQAEADDPDGKPLNFTPTIRAIEPNAFRQDGARIHKFEYKLGATQNLSNDFPILRYSDITLVKAEATARKNGNWDLSLPEVNALRTRADMPAYTSITADEFLAERSREVFYEGWRRSDLIRFGKFNEPHGLRTQPSAPERRLWPVPVVQINANPNLRQNPGY